jgi:hypothetical protein
LLLRFRKIVGPRANSGHRQRIGGECSLGRQLLETFVETIRQISAVIETAEVT